MTTSEEKSKGVDLDDNPQCAVEKGVGRRCVQDIGRRLEALNEGQYCSTSASLHANREETGNVTRHCEIVTEKNLSPNSKHDH